MSQQRALVRFQSSFGSLVEVGDVIEHEGLDWKVEPLDPEEHDVWNDAVRDDERVYDNRLLFGPSPEKLPPQGMYTDLRRITRPVSGLPWSAYS